MTHPVQGLGLVLTPAVAWLILASGDVFHLNWIDEKLYWRLVLGFGGVPGLVLVWLRVMPIPSLKKKVSSIKRRTKRLTCKRLGMILRQLEYVGGRPSSSGSSFSGSATNSCGRLWPLSK